MLQNDVTKNGGNEVSISSPIENQATNEPIVLPIMGENHKARKSKLKLLALPFFLCLITAALTACITALLLVKKFESLVPILQAQEILRSESFYYDANSAEEQWMTGALRGLAYSIDGDNYSEYYTAQEYADLQQEESGNYIGVGILVGAGDDGGFYIEDVFDNTPAMDVGIAIGDKIIEINGVLAAGMGMDPFLDKLNHEIDDINIITMERDGEQITFTVQMREVYRPLVRYRMLDESIGYIQLLAFHGNDVEEMRNALDALSEQGMIALVLDLRDNLGGLLYDCVDIANMFLPKGKIITTLRNRDGEEVEVHRTRLNGRDLPVALLVNEYSASASELFAGALHDHDVAKIFGVTTYGKGIVQSFHSLQGGGILKFTTHAYYTPNGICIQDTGIEPDVYIELPEEWRTKNISLIPSGEDTQLEAALEYLRG